MIVSLSPAWFAKQVQSQHAHLNEILSKLKSVKTAVHVAQR